jgi:alpha/beta superfamily hydrolase
VERSTGVFDHSRGETNDAGAALAYLQTQYPATAPLVLCGFSFGTAVAAQLAQQLPNGKVVAMILAGSAVQRFAPTATVNAETTLMVHGECDETVPLAETLAWAAVQSLPLPISVVPTADHFFNRQLLPLKMLANRHLKAMLG